MQKENEGDRHKRAAAEEATRAILNHILRGDIPPTDLTPEVRRENFNDAARFTQRLLNPESDPLISNVGPGIDRQIMRERLLFLFPICVAIGIVIALFLAKH